MADAPYPHGHGRLSDRVLALVAARTIRMGYGEDGLVERSEPVARVRLEEILDAHVDEPWAAAMRAELGRATREVYSSESLFEGFAPIRGRGGWGSGKVPLDPDEVRAWAALAPVLP